MCVICVYVREKGDRPTEDPSCIDLTTSKLLYAIHSVMYSVYVENRIRSKHPADEWGREKSVKLLVYIVSNIDSAEGRMAVESRDFFSF